MNPLPSFSPLDMTGQNRPSSSVESPKEAGRLSGVFQRRIPDRSDLASFLGERFPLQSSVFSTQPRHSEELPSFKRPKPNPPAFDSSQTFAFGDVPAWLPPSTIDADKTSSSIGRFFSLSLPSTSKLSSSSSSLRPPIESTWFLPLKQDSAALSERDSSSTPELGYSPCLLPPPPCDKDFRFNGVKIPAGCIKKLSEQGYNSTIYEASYLDPISNKEVTIVMKEPKGGGNAKIERVYEDALKQHDDLLLRAQKSLITNPLDRDFSVPIIPILNRSTLNEDKCLIQEKINAFTRAPWTPEQSLEDIKSNPETASYLDQVTKLLIHTLFSEKAGLDLRWTNFGTLPEDTSSEKKIYLFDFFEVNDYPFHLMGVDSIFLLAGRNQDVYKYLLESSKEAWELKKSEIQRYFDRVKQLETEVFSRMKPK